jgi:PTH1 family peptidyl-tRNA hydrolase
VKLIVGLGNPEPRYRNTPHNLGFEVVDKLKDRWDSNEPWTLQWNASLIRRSFESEQIILAKPQTFMNLSGVAVGEISRFFKIEPVDTFVIVDDADLPIGKLRIKPKGSAGGHNGLKSVIQHLNTQIFPRMRIGVGRGRVGDLSSHVLGKFDSIERQIISEAVLRGAEATETFLRFGLERAMQSFNAAEKEEPAE